MRVSKNKTYTNQFSLSEIKEDLDIDASDFTYDGRLNRLLQAACNMAEHFLNEDVVPTVTTIVDENFLLQQPFLEYRLPATSNIVMSAITISNGWSGSTVVVPSSNFRLEHNSNFTNIRFQTSISANQLVIVYKSGMTVIPHAIKTAITLKIRELFDIDVNGYVQSGTKTNTFELLLSPYKNLFY